MLTNTDTRIQAIIPMTNDDSVFHTLKSRLIKGSIWALAGKLLTILAALIVNAVLARMLTPGDMGAYFLAFSLMSVATVLAQFGLNKTVVRLVAESIGADRPGRAVVVVRKIFLSTILSTIVVAGLLLSGIGKWLALYVFHSASLASVVMLVALWMAIITLRNLQAETFRGFHDIRLATVFGDGLTRILLSLLLLGLWVTKSNAELEEILWLSIFAASVSVLYAAVILKKKLDSYKTITMNADDDFVSYRQILTISGPLLITSLTIFLLTQVDIWIISAYRPQEEIAIYGVATRLVLLVATPLLILNAVLPPIIAELHSQEKKTELETVLRATATLAATPAILVLFIFIFWGDSVLELVYGSYYKQAGHILALLSCGQLINVWAGSCGFVLMMTGHQNTMMHITASSGLFVVVGALAVVEQYGSTGVALITIMGMVLQKLLELIFVKRKTGIWTPIKFSLLRPKIILKNVW